MAFWTQGTITFHAPANKISITPIVDYQVTHDKTSYTIFVKTGRSHKSKIFPTTKPLKIRKKIRRRLKSLLIRAAFNKASLRIAINDDDRVTEVIIPARS